MPSENSHDAIRDALMETHRLLLEFQRGLYEQEHGPLASPYVFLKLTLEHERFQWLRPIGQLILEWDDVELSARNAQWTLNWLSRVEAVLDIHSENSPLQALNHPHHQPVAWRTRVADARKRHQAI